VRGGGQSRGERHTMERGRRKEAERPRRGKGVRSRVESESGRIVEAEAERVQRMREPAADRLKVRFFQHPQLDEPRGPLLLRTRIEFRELRLGEIALRDVAGIGGALDRLDIDADLRVACDGAGDETVGVGEVERERRSAEVMRERRLSVAIGHERPCVRAHIVVPRQDAAE
jgi:hypothetical protein